MRPLTSAAISHAHATWRWAGDRRVLVDVLFAGFIAVLAVADVAAPEAMPGQRDADLLAYAMVLVGAMSLVWRRRAPVAVLAVVTAVILTYWMRGHGSFLSVLGLPAWYAVAVHGTNRRWAWAAIASATLVALVVASLTILDTVDGFDFVNLTSVAAYLAGATGAGVVVRNRERIFVDTQRRAEEAEADRLVEAQRAVARERSRIAREMHDVLAHSMSVIAVQAAAAQEIARSNPAKVVNVLGRIEAIGRESLTEMRRMLGVLRDGDEPISLAPQPTLNDVRTVIAQCAESGIPTELVITGDQRALPAGIDLAAFRIVQEALTNVLKHAGPCGATVRLNYGVDALRIAVIDDGCGSGSTSSKSGGGHGLIGMRERVEIYDGEFSAGPAPEGGYRVRAVLPLDARATLPASQDTATVPAP
jgi:signal transduction histidine kinase